MKTDPVVGRGVNWQMIGVYKWVIVAWISKSVVNSNNKFECEIFSSIVLAPVSS